MSKCMRMANQTVIGSLSFRAVLSLRSISLIKMLGGDLKVLQQPLKTIE